MDSSENATKPSLSLWVRIPLFIVAFMIVGGIFQLIGVLAAGVPLKEISKSETFSIGQHVVIGLFELVSLSLIIILFRREIDRQSIMSLGFSFAKRYNDLLAGLAVAVSTIGIGTLILYTLGYISMSSVNFDAKTVLLSFILFICVAINEEVLMRGYILNNLMTGMNKYLALLLSSSIFGLLHLFNDGVTVLAMVNLILAGILLGSSYIFTKNLWFPISLHLFWNFFQGPVLGYSVSGMKVNPIFTLSSTGNELFTGGEFGFEGSIVCTVLLVAATAAVIGYYGKKTAAAKEVQLAYQEIG